MASWASPFVRAWTRWAYLVNGCDPARIDDPDERRRFFRRIKSQGKWGLYVTGSLFILLSPVVALIIPRDLTVPQMFAGVAAGVVTLAVGAGLLVWGWRT
jgi:protein-S-isoprenylcysteine O-methyltransferase Ste14